MTVQNVASSPNSPTTIPTDNSIPGKEKLDSDLDRSVHRTNAFDTFGNEDVVMTGEKDYAFYAEKSRI